MANGNEKLVWIDCEMTGLDVSIDELVEVAVVITDFDLNILDDGFNIVIKPSQAALDHMGEFVHDMHESSGLLEALPDGVSIEEAQTAVLEYIQKFVPAAGQAPLAGNTIGTDRTFHARYMPLVDGHMHYRSVDVSSIKELVRRWIPRVYFNSPEKGGGHRALADILESIRELEYYRRTAFVADPGPTTSAVQTVAASVVENFAARL